MERRLSQRARLARWISPTPLRWAKDTLDPRHHPIVDEGLAWWRGQPADPAFADVATRARATADLVLAAADAAARL